MPTFKEHFLNNFPNVSLEGLIDGVQHQEIEFTMYVEVVDLEDIKKKAIRSERHEQWNVPLDRQTNPSDSKLRIRLIDDARPTICTKIVKDHTPGAEEVEADITMDLFKALRQMCAEGYIKTRYVIPSNIQGLVWEVDVFYSNGGAQHPWVKVDLEVKSINDPIPVFPIPHRKVIFSDGEMTYSDQLKIKTLWEKDWQKIVRT